jgi:hypothetical protein
MSTGPDRERALHADQGYPEASNDATQDLTAISKGFVAGKGKAAQPTPAATRVLWIVLLMVFGPPFIIGLIRLNQWLWSL